MSSSRARREAKRVTSEDIDLIERLWCAKAREDFLTFRMMIRPDLKVGWFVQEVAAHLQRFYDDYKAGKRPVLILQAPPQHGKSWTITDFIAWVTGKELTLNTIYTSYSQDLGLRCNTSLQRIFDSPGYQRVFPNLTMGTGQGGLGRPARNSFLLEFAGEDGLTAGSFRNTTVEGQITGQSLDLGVIDDPIKGRAEASSEHLRNKVWEWFGNDFFTRFAEHAGMLMIMTRWHLDDPAGRFIEHYPEAKVLRYAALAEHTERHRKEGDALFPELKSRTFILDRKKVMTQAGFESVYQQNPIVVGGDMFPVDKIKVVDAMPNSDQILRSVRYWDKAGTEGGTGARTAGVLMHMLTDGNFIVENVVSGRWKAQDREKRIKQTCQLDNYARFTETFVEQEPGSGGKESAESTVRMLAGYVAAADRVTGKKEIRAEPYAAQVQAGNISIVLADWNREFLDEHEKFPNGKLKDQVDAAGAAFSKLTIREDDYDASMSWVTNRN